MRKHQLALIIGLAASVAAPALAADNYPVIDASSTTRTKAAKADGTGVLFDKQICVTLADTTIDCTTALNAATNAPQANAGSDASKAVSVQGITGGKAVPVSAASLPLPTGATTESTLSAMSGKLPASLGAKTGAGSVSVVPASDGFPVTVSGVATAANQTTTNTALGAPGATVCATDTGSCDINAKLSRLTSQVTALKTSVDGMATDIATIKNDTTDSSVKISQATDGTTNLVAAKQSGTWTVQVGNTPNTAPIFVQRANTSTPVRIASAAATTNLTQISDSGGCTIGHFIGSTVRTSAVYAKFYNTDDASVTVGTTTPYLTIPLPAGGTNPTSFEFDIDQKFASGACSVAFTTAAADNSTAALTAGDLVGVTITWNP